MHTWAQATTRRATYVTDTFVSNSNHSLYWAIEFWGGFSTHTLTKHGDTIYWHGVEKGKAGSEKKNQAHFILSWAVTYPSKLNIDIYSSR